MTLRNLTGQPIRKSYGRIFLDSPTDGKSRIICLRLTPAEKLAFTTAANRVGLSLSAWIRNTLRSAVGLPPVGPPTISGKRMPTRSGKRVLDVIDNAIPEYVTGEIRDDLRSELLAEILEERELFLDLQMTAKRILKKLSARRFERYKYLSLETPLRDGLRLEDVIESR